MLLSPRRSGGGRAPDLEHESAVVVVVTVELVVVVLHHLLPDGLVDALVLQLLGGAGHAHARLLLRVVGLESHL